MGRFWAFRKVSCWASRKKKGSELQRKRKGLHGGFFLSAEWVSPKNKNKKKKKLAKKNKLSGNYINEFQLSFLT
jgi:hypothetical protein